jgi:hypothetical protein
MKNVAMKRYSFILFAAFVVAVNAKKLRNYESIDSVLPLVASTPTKLLEETNELEKIPYEHDDRQLNNRVYDIDKRVGYFDSSVPLSSGRYNLWYNLWPKLDSTKTERAVWDNTTSRPTFNRYHMFVLPCWWDGENQTTPYNLSLVQAMLDETALYYKQMSWNKHTFSYELWRNQTVLVNHTIDDPVMGQAAEYVQKFVNDLGRVQFKDYSGITMMYNRAKKGNLANGGGWGVVNGTWTRILASGKYFSIIHTTYF